jgi:DNA-binding NarL/FixJ family response regulator
MKNQQADRITQRRIMIVDDHPMTRRGLVQLISAEPDLVVSAEAGSAQQALAVLVPPLPDLVLADITMPGKSGLEFIKEMQALHPEVPVLVLSMHDESIYAERVLRSGGRGYIMKTEGGEKLLTAIRRVLEGQLYVSEGMSATILATFANRRSAAPETGLAVLTDREFEVFQLLGQGLSTRQIGARLGISIPTVGTHRMQIKKKLKLETGSQLTQRAVRWAASQQAI